MDLDRHFAQTEFASDLLVHLAWRRKEAIDAALGCSPRTGLSACIRRALSDRTCDIFGIARFARVQTVASGSEMPDLQKSADDHDVLEKMKHLVPSMFSSLHRVECDFDSGRPPCGLVPILYFTVVK